MPCRGPIAETVCQTSGRTDDREDGVVPYERSPNLWPGRMLSVLRIVTAMLYLEHGTSKIFSWPPAARPELPYVLASLNGVAGLIETLGGILMLFGWFTRPVAFLASGEMAVAYFKVHFPRSIFPIGNGGDNVVLFCFIFLYFVFVGGGLWSVDAMRRRPRR